jgi:hypothetical protein
MMIVSGLVTCCNLVLSFLVGVWLLRLSRRSPGGPEIWLALYFLVGAFLGMGLANIVYMSWADPSLALPQPLTMILHALYLFGVTAGMGCLYVFTRLTFRPDARWARLLVAGVILTMVVGYVGIGLSDGFQIRVVPGVSHWITWAVRTSVFLWLVVESFAYWARLRRRLRLGLADPLVTNRFLLWGIWASATLLMGQLDPLSRIWYVARAGTTEQWVPELGTPIVMFLVASSAGLGALVMCTVYLIFFPTAGYRRWIESRGVAFSSAASGVSGGA